MFIGEYQHTLDEKGRLIMPARFRELLGDRFVITKGLDSCLFIYPMSEWVNLGQKLRTIPTNKPEGRAFVRMFFSGAHECELDRQGRVLIPPALRQYARLEKEAVVIGVASRVEVWSRADWESYSRNAEGSFGEIAERVTDIEL